MSDIPVWTDIEHRRELDIVRKDTSERCALLCELMAGVYDSHAATLRKEGEYNVRAVWPFGKLITKVHTEFERSAMLRDNMARTFRTVAACCRAGWDPRSLMVEAGTKLDPSILKVFLAAQEGIG